MKQFSKHDVNKLTAKELQDNLPFQILNDGEVIAVVLPMTDVNILKKKTKPDKELPLSKSRQARCELPKRF